MPTDSNRTSPAASWRHRTSALALAPILLMTAGWATAQESSKPQPSQSAGESKPAAKAGLFGVLDKKSLIFPDIAVSTKPLSPGQKFELFVDNSLSVHSVLGAAAGAAISQASNSPTGFEQGWEAYGKRFGSSMARQASQEFFGTFVLASALHQDPRFYPEVNPSFGHAVKYSVERVFVTRNDAGHDVPNVSGLLGPGLAEALANAYWPERNRSVGDTLVRYGFDLATRAGGNLLREYLPVIHGKLRHTKPSSSTP